MAGGRAAAAREWVAQAFTHVEDVVYVGLGVLLATSALAMLAAGAVDLVRGLLGGAIPSRVIALLDQILLILMIVEILYTVQVSFREHVLRPEPFLVVGLIAATRRLLVLTAEFGELLGKGQELFRNAMIELGLLTAMIVALVVAIVLLRRQAPTAAANKA